MEQKNWSVVRRLVGYGRYESPAALAQLNLVYRELRGWTNGWQPTLKLVAKVRNDATGKTHKTYDLAQTPAQRLLAAAILDEPGRAALAETFAARGPRATKRRIDAAVVHLLRLQERPNELSKLANAG